MEAREYVRQSRCGHLTVKTTTPLLFKSSKDRSTEENRKFSLAGEPGSPRRTAGSRGRPKPDESLKSTSRSTITGLQKTQMTIERRLQKIQE